MSEPVNLEWNPANWITVLLMVAIGFTVLGFVTRLWQQKQSTPQGTVSGS